MIESATRVQVNVACKWDDDDENEKPVKERKRGEKKACPGKACYTYENDQRG